MGIALAVGILTAGFSGCGPSAADRLMGRWEGSLEVNQPEVDRQIEASDSPLKQQLGRFMADGLKSLKLDLEFHPDGRLTMSGKFGPLERVSRASWEVVEQQGDRITIRSVDEKGNEQQTVLTFEGPDTFLMKPPEATGNDRLGVFRFKRVVD